MRLRDKVLAVAVLCGGLFISGGASAAGEFFISYSSLIIGSCTSTQITGQVNADYAVPAGSSNLVAFVHINAGPQITSFFTLTPATFTGPLNFTYPIPTTAQPYTISADVFPALNGAATGIGTRGAFTCNLDGSISVVFNPVDAGLLGTATSVPTLSTWGLIALGVLLGLLTMLRLRRRQQ